MGDWACAYCDCHSSSALIICDFCGRGRPGSFAGGNGMPLVASKTASIKVTEEEEEEEDTMAEDRGGGPDCAENDDDRHTPPPPAKRARNEVASAAAAAATPSSGRARGGAFKLNPTASSPPNPDIDVTLREILMLGELEMSVQLNFKFDVGWMMQQYPESSRCKPLWIVHGFKTDETPESPWAGINKDIASENSAIKDRYNLDFGPIKHLQAPGIPPFGTHHTKMMLLFYGEAGMRVVVHTANMLKEQWEHKTNGIWVSPLFPRRDRAVDRVEHEDYVKVPLQHGATSFAHDLVVYLKRYTVGEPTKPPKKARMYNIVRRVLAHRIEIDGVRFLGSVPGTFQGADIDAWGHRRLRKHLSEIPEVLISSSDEVVMQMSSISSTNDKRAPGKWLTELKASLSGMQPEKDFFSKVSKASKAPKINLIFPTVKEIKDSTEGYRGGGSVPHSRKNADGHLKELRQAAHHWQCTWSGRTRAIPHIKTYARWNTTNNRLVWCLLASHNLSMAAWGKIDKSGKKLQIKSYEAGVLFVPVAGELLAAGQHQNGVAESVPVCPVPYDFPLTKYLAQRDAWWVWDDEYTEKDVLGNTWTTESRSAYYAQRRPSCF